MSSFEVWRRGGVVAGVQTFTETTTTTTSSGGGGYLHQGSGYIASPTTSTTSRTTTTQRVFVQDQHGEWTFNVEEGFAIRPGNHILARFINSRHGGTRMHDVDNLSTGKGWIWPIKNHLPRTRWIWLVWLALSIVFAIVAISNFQVRPSEVKRLYGLEPGQFIGLHVLAFFVVSLLPLGLLVMQYVRRGRLKREIEASLAGMSQPQPQHRPQSEAHQQPYAPQHHAYPPRPEMPPQQWQQPVSSQRRPHPRVR